MGVARPSGNVDDIDGLLESESRFFFERQIRQLGKPKHSS